MSLSIMFIATEYPPKILGGLGTHLFELAKGLSSTGSRVTILVPTEGETEINDEPNISVHWASMAEIQADILDAPLLRRVNLSSNIVSRYAQNLIEKRKEKPSAIHCHDWLGFPAAQQLGSKLRIPVVATIHLLYGATLKLWGENVDPNIVRFEKELCQHAATIITVSKAMREMIKATYGVPGERIHVVYNGMDLEAFNGTALNPEEVSSLRQSLATPDEKIIFFAGRLAPQKGVTALLESASEVISRTEKARYVIAGSYDDMNADQLTQLYRNSYPQYSKLWNKLRFLGLVTRQQIAMLYKVADIAIVPSIYEPFGYAALEAMAAGVPVIASDTGGLSEVVLHGKTGLLIPVRPNGMGRLNVDVKKLTDAQMFLLNNHSLAKQMGRVGQQRVLTEFTQKQMVKSTRDIYHSIASGSGAI